MAKSLNSYAKTLINEHRGITNLIHEHGGYDKQNLSDAEINSALKHPHARLVHEMLHALAGYIRSYREQIDVRSSLQDQLIYLADIMPVVELHSEQVLGEDRAILGEVTEEMKSQFTELMNLNTELNINLDILQSALRDLETYAEVIDRDWHKFRHEILQKIVESLEQQNIPLSAEDKKDLLNESGWGELIKQVRAEKVPLPKTMDFSKPNYASYFELKRCVAIARSQMKQGQKPVAVNDHIHSEIQNKVKEFGLQSDGAMLLALRQYESFFHTAKQEAESILKKGLDKKSLLLDLHVKVAQATQVNIPDTESINSIAARTIAKDINIYELIGQKTKTTQKPEVKNE